MQAVPVCRACCQPLPPLAVAYHDPFCSRPCMEQFCHGHTEHDHKKSLLAAEAVHRKRAHMAATRSVSTLRGTLAALGFRLTTLNRRLETAAARCVVCSESVAGTFADLPWLAVEHRRSHAS
jgi:hypothetical protein